MRTKTNNGDNDTSVAGGAGAACGVPRGGESPMETMSLVVRLLKALVPGCSRKNTARKKLMRKKLLLLRKVKNSAGLLKKLVYSCGCKTTGNLSWRYNTMENTNTTIKTRRMLHAADIAEVLDISISSAYNIINALNRELENAGYLTVRGRIDEEYFISRYFTKTA